MAKILAIDDDPSILELLKTVLTLEGHSVETEPNGRLGMRRFAELHPDLVVTDLMMPEQEGIETIRMLREIDEDVAILAISAAASKAPGVYLQAAEALGADATLAKPFANRDLCEVVRKLLDARGR